MSHAFTHKIRDRAEKMKQAKCLSDADKRKLKELENELDTAESIANSDDAAKQYWNDTGRKPWQKKEKVSWDRSTW